MARAGGARSSGRPGPVRSRAGGVPFAAARSAAPGVGDPAVRDSMLLRRLPAAVVVVDDHGDVVYWNDEAAALFGRARDDVLGAPVGGLGIWPHAMAQWRPAPESPGEPSRPEEHRVTLPDGSSVAVRTRATRLDDPRSGFRGLLGLSVATAERRRVPGSTSRLPLARSDPATGLPNWQVFVDHLERTMARNAQAGRLTAVFSVGVRQDRGSSDAHAEDLPRSALRALAKRITRVLREHDLVAYLGEGQFAVCCDVWDREDSLVVGRRMLRAASAASTNPALRRASTSVGAAVADGGSRPEDLLREAEAARRGATVPEPGVPAPGVPAPGAPEVLADRRRGERAKTPEVFALRAERRPPPATAPSPRVEESVEQRLR